MLESNQILQGRYHIIRPLGHGGMGTVYEARDTKLFGKLVALKEILLDKTLIPDQKDYRIVSRAFEREAQILTKLEHEAFPQVIDYFVENDCQFLVMELIHGKDLSVLLRKRKTPFEVEEVIQWAIQLLDALDYLHTLDPPTIHRDIKPQNLKLTARKRIKLLDFGIAKGAELAPSNITFSNQTFIAATFNYSPFEQVFRVLDSSFKDALKPFYGEQLAEIANQTADARSDIYALGATFYHLLTKQLPFDSLKRTLEHWVGNNDPLPSPKTLNPDIPTEISDWILQAMKVERDSRFASAAAMRDALQEIVEGSKIYQESTRNLKWQKEQELLLTERERLAEERRKFEQERLEFLHTTQEPISEAATIRDFPEADWHNSYKTKTSFQPDLFNQPSITTVVGEQLPKEEFTKIDSPTDFTATSYLVDLKLGSEQEKTELPKTQMATPQIVAPAAMQRKPVSYFPISLIILFLLGGTVLGGLILQNVGSEQKTADKTAESIVSNQNSASVSTPVQEQIIPEVAPTVTTEIPFQNVSNSSTETVSTPKPSSEIKPKQVNQIAKPPTPLPTLTPQTVKTATPKPTQTPKPKNPDCIFNNDCR